MNGKDLRYTLWTSEGIRTKNYGFALDRLSNNLRFLRKSPLTQSLERLGRWFLVTMDLNMLIFYPPTL